MTEEIVIDVRASQRKLTVDLDEEERERLKEARDTHDKAYMREKAAALLKSDQNWSARAIAQHGLNRPRQPKTVRSWIHRYKEEGFDALEVSDGRGRKAAFSP